MARRLDKENAIKYRKKGLTYSEIREILNIPKSTLSDWLSGYHLSNKELNKLQKSIKRRKFLGIEKTRIAKAKKRKKRLKLTYDLEKKLLNKLDERELYIAGLLLYWGEGRKNIRHSQISLSNTDPEMIKFFMRWLIRSFNVNKDRLKVILHLYSDMDIKDSTRFWSEKLEIPENQFVKPFVKESKYKHVSHKGKGYGTCNVYINDILLKEKIIMGIKVIADDQG